MIPTNTRSVLTKQLLPFAIMLCLLTLFTEVKAQLPITESFTNSTAPGLTFGGTPGAFLTAPSIDANGSGFLRLTGIGNNETGFARSTGSFSSAKGVAVQFEYFSYGGGNPGADGITFFLYDATASPFVIGAFGGSLGYAQKTGIVGVSKGFIGIGLDEYGNYAREGEGRIGGPPVSVATPDGPTGYYASTVGLRGSGDGDAAVAGNYEYLTSVQTNAANAMTGVGTNTGQGPTFELIGRVDGRTITSQNIDGYRKVFMELSPNGQVGIGQAGFNITVTIMENTGGGAGNLRTHTIVQNYSYIPNEAIPENLSYGFAASTGGSVNTHEIRNIEIIASAAIAPEAFNDSGTTPENQAITINVLSNDRDQNGNGTKNLASIDLNPSTPLVEDKTITVNGVGTYVANNDGTVTFTPVANYNGTPAALSYSFKDTGSPAKTSNSGLDVPIAHATITVTVTANNSAPTGTNKTITTNEDTSYPLVAADFGFADAGDNTPNNFQSVTLTTLPANGVIKLSGTDVTTPGTVIPFADLAGNLTYHPVANENGTTYTTFTFQVQDDGGTSNGGTNIDASANTITINVTPVNDIPSFTAGANQTVAEDAGAQTVNGWVTASSQGPANENTQTVTYPIVSNSAPLKFSAGPSVSSAGVLTYTPAPNAAGNATIVLRIKDSGGTSPGVDESATQSFTITITSVNDAPAGTDKTITAAEDAGYTFAASDFGFTDPNDNPANTFLNVKITTLPTAGALTLSGNPVAAGQNIGVADIPNLIFTPAANANGTAYSTFTFQVQDNGGTTPGVDLDASPNTITFDIAAANDAPAGTDKTITSNEDADYTFAAADFGFTDPNDNPSNTLLSVTITTVPGAGTLKKNGVDVTAGQTVLAADIPTLVYTPALNAKGTAYTTFTFQVKDNGGTTPGADLDLSANTITFDITSVNDAPAGTNKTVTTIEDTGYTFAAADFGFTDPNDNPANTFLTVKITTIPAAGSLKKSGVDVVAGQVVPVADIANLIYTPALNANGTAYANFTFQVQDNGGTAPGVDLDATPNSITFDVTAANDAPSGTNKTVSSAEDTPYTFTAADFGFTDPNDSPANSFLAVKITTVPVLGSLKKGGVDVTAGQTITVADIPTLAYTPAANAQGTAYANFTFQVQDNGGTSPGVDLDATPNTITFDITSANDAPAGADKAVTMAEDATYTFAAADFGFTDPNDNPANTFLSVKITTLPVAGTLKKGGVNVTAGQSIAAADIATLVYTPVANAGGTAYSSFTFQVQDNGGTSPGVDLDASPNTITFNVTPANDAPAGTDKTVIMAEDAAYTFAAADFGFTDPSDNPANTLLAVQITTLPALGTLRKGGVNVTAGQSIAAADIATLVYTPVANAGGTAYSSFTFQVQDNGGTSPGVDLDASPNTITFNVTPANDAPAGTDKVIASAEDASYTFSASDFGFTDLSDNPANTFSSVTITSTPTVGTLRKGGVNVTAGQVIPVSEIPTLVFTPAANAKGTGYANFTFQVQDNGGTNPGTDLDPTPNTITFDISSVNDAPAGTDKVITSAEDDSYTFTAADFGFTDSNDTPANSFLNVKLTTLPALGSIKKAGVDVVSGQVIAVADIPSLVYTPVANASGNSYASFTFQVQDNGGTPGIDLDASPNTITLNITGVNDIPVVADVTKTVLEDVTLAFSASDFTGKFTDTDSDALNKIKIIDLPSNGTLKLSNVDVIAGAEILTSQISNLTFVPTAQFNGAVTFRWNGSDGVAYAPTNASVNITVNPVNDAPSFTAGSNQTLVATSGSNTVNGWATGLAKGPANETSQTLTFIVTNSNNSLFSVQPAIDAAGNLTYTLSGSAGSATVNVSVRDNGGTANGGVDISAQQIFTITATAVPVNNAPPVVQNLTRSGLKDQTITFTAANFADADHYADPENVALVKIRIISLPTSGTLKLDGVNITAGQEIPAADLAKITFVPASGFTGTVSFEWNGSDGVSYATVARTVTISVLASNTPPIIADITKTGSKDTPVTFTNSDFTDKFTDTDPLNKVKIVTLPTSGTLKLNGINITQGQEIPAADLAKITFVPATGYVGGPLSFQWNASDGFEYAATPKNVNITINPNNTAPVAVADNYTTTKGGTLTVAMPGVLNNDTDTDGNTLSAIKVTNPPNGVVTLNANGSFVYTHNGGTSNSDVFTYKVNDGTADGNTVSVTITITTVNGPPVVYDLPKIGTGFTPITFTPEEFKGKYSDPASDPLTKIIITSLPPVGTLKLNGVAVSVGQEIPVANLGGLTFEPPVNWSGTTSFGWNGSDGTLYAANPANVSLTVVLSGDPSAKIGLAKSLASITPALNATFDVKFIFTAVNYGMNGLENVSLRDNLLLAFGGATATVKSILGFGNLRVNNSYNGSSDTELLLTTSKLSAGEQARVELVVNVKLGLTGGLFQNSATTQGTSAINGVKVTDVSTNGLKPDPLTANDVSPSDATPIQLDALPTYVPQGFSPNGDGQNDKFVIQNALGKHVSLEVYNRWGNRVYKSMDYKNDWGGEVTEGFFLGRDIPDGTYYYIIIIEKNDKYTGFITINR